MEHLDPLYSDEEECDYESELKHNVTKLVDGIDLKDLLKTSTATFEINTNVESALEEQQNNYFSNDDFLKSVNLDCIDPGSDDEDGSECGPGKTPFDRIAMRMTDLTGDGKLKKRVIREGAGDVVPRDSLIWIHYNAYLEYADEPYDSTYLRGRPMKIRLNAGSLVIGLEMGIITMKKNEIAQFLIHPDLAYGKLGVPPRIPGEADVLIHVELLQILDNAAAVEVEGLSNEEKEKAGFAKIYKCAEGWVLKANDLYSKKNLQAAIHNYRKAINVLETAHMKNEEEQKKQQKLLLRSYINLAVCYNKQNASRQACTSCRSALDIDPKNAKALFNYAKAQMYLGGFDQAKAFAMRARKQEPHNAEVNELLQKLDARLKMYKEGSSAFAKKAFSFSEEKQQPEIPQTVTSFEEETRKYLKEFIDDDNASTLQVPGGMTQKEENFLKEESEKLGLSCRLLEKSGQMYIKKK